MGGTVQKYLKTLGVWLTETAIAGMPLIPFMIFLVSFENHEGAFSYVLPVVLYYAFNKTGDFMLGVFGEVKNTYRLAQIGGILVVTGGAVSLFGGKSLTFYDVGATLIGLGTSIYNPMYSSLKARLREEGKFPYRNPELVGMTLMTLFVLVILMTEGHLETVLISTYIGLSVVSLLTLNGLGIKERFKGEPLFDYSKHDFKKIIPAFLFFFMVLFVRLYKQTATFVDVLILFLVATIAVTLVFLTRHHAEHEAPYRLQDVFYGEVSEYAVLFDVFYYMAMGDMMSCFAAVVIMMASMTVAMAFGDKIATRVRMLRNPALTVGALIAALILFLVPAANLICLILITLFSAIGRMLVKDEYKKDATSVEEQSLSTARMGGIGSVLGQTELAFALAGASLLLLHNGSAALEPYADRISVSDLDGVFFLAQVICTLVFVIQGIVLLIGVLKESKSSK